MYTIQYEYIKYDENGKKLLLPNDDFDGKITGTKGIFGLRAWMDEHEQDRKNLGWIKHIFATKEEKQHDEQTQVIFTSLAKVDDYTIKDVVHVVEKSEEYISHEIVNEESFVGGLFIV